MHLLTKLQRHPGFLRFLSHEALGAVLLKPLAPVLKARCLAESVHRVWLYAGGPDGFEPAERFEGVWMQHSFPEAIVTSLFDWARTQHIARSYTLPKLWAEWATVQLRQELGFLLQGWREADGIIALIALEADCLRTVGLPFRIRDNVGTHGPRSLGHGGVPRGLELDEGVEAAVLMARHAKWIGRHDSFAVELTTIEGSCGIPISGASCGLSVALARGFRSEGLRVPVFELAASGTLSSGGTSLACHRDADTLFKKETLLRSLGVKQVILPGDGSSHWQCGEDIVPMMQNLFAELRPIVPKDSHDALMERVIADTTAMHCGHKPADLVERLMRRILAEDLPISDSHLVDVRAEALLTLSAALSHLGRPSDAQDANAQALALAHQLPSSWRGLALARTAVILQDLGEYAAAAEHCDQALSAVTESSHDIVALELDMKASGTKGQVLACWGLCEPRPSRSSEALGLLEHARQCAQSIDARCRGASEPEEPRNVAYLYWWHALHAPERTAEVWDEAWATAEEKDLGKSTQHYLLRHRWLAVYRSLLLVGRLPEWVTVAETFRLPDGGPPWLHSTARKYRGAWHASEGRANEATEDFAKAIGQLRNMHDGISLFDFFAATTALQAGRSLQHLDPDRGAGFLQQALSLFEECEAHMPWFQGSHFAGKRWIKLTRALIAGHESTENPQLYYPY
jgi:tetratricopeptide (TPR) repeat protein